MIMIYFLTLPWFVCLGHIFIMNSDDDVEPLMMTLAIYFNIHCEYKNDN